jgi:ferredoxin
MVKGTDVVVDKSKCIGCGACIASFEELFKFDDQGKSEVKTSAECEDCDIADVIAVCPQGAISKTESKETKKAA